MGKSLHFKTSKIFKQIALKVHIWKNNETRSLEWEIQESGAMTQEKTLADEKENIREEKKFVFLK